MISDDQIRDMVRTMESIVWAVRPDRIRALPMMEQRIWLANIILQIHTGKKAEDK